MLWTASAAAWLINEKRPPAGGLFYRGTLFVLGAVAGSDALLLRVLRGVRLDHGTHQLAVGLHPVGQHLPLRAVPLLELHQAGAFVVVARDLDGRHQAGRAELLETLVVDVEVLDAPAHLLAGDRLALPVLSLREADRLDGDDAGDD